LMIMALYPIHQVYGQLCGAVLYSSGKTNIIRNVSIPFQVLGLVMVFFFISNENYGGLNLGSIGLIYKMILIQIIVVNIYLWYCTKMLSISFFKYVYLQLKGIFVLFIISFLSVYLFKNFTDYLILNILFNGTFYLVSVILLIYTFPSFMGLNKSDIIYFKNKLININNNDN